jgi:hypothetical protein
MCIDFKTGATIFQDYPVKSSYKYRNGCLTYADGMFYLYSDDGKLALARPTDRGFEVTGRLEVKDPGKSPTWAHPVVLDGRLYLRYGDKLAVYRVAGYSSSHSVLCVAPTGPFKPETEVELLAELNAQLPFEIPLKRFISQRRSRGLIGWAVVQNDREKDMAKAELKKSSTLKLLQVESLSPEFEAVMRQQRKPRKTQR